MIGGVGLCVAAGYLLWHYEAPWWVMLVAMAGYIVDGIGAEARAPDQCIGQLARVDRQEADRWVFQDDRTPTRCYG
jgi:hypothetical protein